MATLTESGLEPSRAWSLSTRFVKELIGHLGLGFSEVSEEVHCILLVHIAI